MPTNPSLQDAINELMMLFSMGRYAETEQRARLHLKAFRKSPIVLELLGMAIGAQYRFPEALGFLEKAVRVDPKDAQFWENLGQCQRQLRQYAEAEKSLRRALALNPAAVVSMDALASVLRELHRHEDAQEIAAHLAARDPGYAKRQSLAQEHALRNAIAAEPNNAGFHDQLGLLLRINGDLAGAEASFRRALECDSRQPRSLINLALLLSAQRRDHEALPLARSALALLGDITPKTTPETLDLFGLAAFVLDMARASSEACRIYKALRRINPDPALALPMVYAARKACDWEFAASLEQEACRAARTHLDMRRANPGHLFGLASATPLDQLAAAQSYARQVQQARPARPPSARTPAAGPNKRLRVSYFSRDFYDHPTAVLLVGVIEAHDRSQFEIVAHDFSPPSDGDYRQRLDAAFERVVLIRDLSDEAAARRLAGDQIDVLIDLNGWTTGHRAPVLAARPAPLQVQWLGHAGTMGAPWIDYIIADPVLIPPHHEGNFSEKIIRLPHSYQPADNKRPIAPPKDRQDHGLPASGFVFCCFNQAFKVTPEVFERWMTLLKTVDPSVLWLLDPGPDAADALRRAAAAHDVAAERLIFAPVLSFAEHLERASHADLALDCCPYGSHTTASDMLWAGVPLVALSAETFASRVSASVLTAGGMPDLVTSSLDESQRLALRLATTPSELAAVRARIRDQRATSALFDTPGFTRKLEQALVAISERHARGLPPDRIAIA